MIQLKAKPQIVALADPRWSGHHPTYFKEFAASLLRLGHRVIALCRQPEEMREAAAEICKNLGIDADERVLVAALDDPDRSFLLPGCDHDPISTIARWNCLRRALGAAERESAWRADLVFLPWLDSYLRFQPTKSLPTLLLGRPWSGLYFRNHHFAEERGLLSGAAKGDRSLRNRNCRAVGVLDERFEDEMSSASGQPIIPFPDITDETDPGTELSPLAKRILKEANGRPIIGMVSLEKRKGFLSMLRLAERVADREDWFFVAAGMYNQDTCSAEEQDWIAELDRRVNRNGELGNIHLELPGQRVSDGAEFNSLIKSFDCIYAAYEGFQGSSNALTKAAAFHTPVLATRGECVGERVEEYRLGLTIGQGNLEQGEDAIRRILSGIDWNGRLLRPRYEEYHALHDRERLDQVFEEILAIGG